MRLAASRNSKLKQGDQPLDLLIKSPFDMFAKFALKYLEFRKKRQLDKLGVNNPDLPVQLLRDYKSVFANDVNKINELAAEILATKPESLKTSLLENPGYVRLKESIASKLDVFQNKPYQLGAIDVEIDMLATVLYHIQEPRILEIGVANGYSSAFLYYVASQIAGSVTSIDMPRIATTPYLPQDIIRHWLSAKELIENSGTLKDLKPGGVVPKERYPGWLVPMSLRTSVPNVSVFGNAFLVLDDLPDSAVFDFVVLDAVKDYDQRTKMLEQVTRHLSPNGFCAQDGYWVNSAFDDFCTLHGFSSWKFGRVAMFSNHQVGGLAT